MPERHRLEIRTIGVFICDKLKYCEEGISRIEVRQTDDQNQKPEHGRKNLNIIVIESFFRKFPIQPPLKNPLLFIEFICRAL